MDTRAIERKLNIAMDFLQILTSDKLDFDALLRALPPFGQWELRAALLERMER